MSCSGDKENLNPNSNESDLLFRNSFERFVIGKVIDGQPNPIVDFDEIEKKFIDDSIFINVESIKLEYGYNTQLSKYEAYLTIIADEEIDNSMVSVAFQVELVIEGDDLVVENPDFQPSLFNKHSCTGLNCRTCMFERGGFLGLKIIGCLPCANVNDVEKPGYCNHSINGGGAPIKEVIHMIK